MNKKLVRLTEGDIHRIVKESVKRILREGYVSNDGNGMVGGHYGSSTETGYTYLPWEDALYEMTQNGMLSEREEKILDKYFSQFEHEFEIGAVSEYSWDDSTNSQEGHITKFEDDFEHAMEFVRFMNHPLLTPERKDFILNYFEDAFYSDFDNPDYDSFTWEHPEDEYDDDPDRY
jgi:hypothetical protein